MEMRIFENRLTDVKSMIDFKSKHSVSLFPRVPCCFLIKLIILVR